MYGIVKNHHLRITVDIMGMAKHCNICRR